MGENQEIIDEVKRLRTRIKALEEKGSTADEGKVKALEERLSSIEGKLKSKASVDFVDWDS